MFAVFKTGGKQYRAKEGEVLKVEKLNMEEGKTFSFEDVLLVEGDGDPLIGTPFVPGAVVKAKILRNFRDDKVIVFKKKRRKQYKKTQGHRQELTEVQVEKIVVGKAPAPKAKTAPKKAEDKKVDEIVEELKAEVKKADKPAKKAEPAPKTEAKPEAKAEPKPKAAPKPKAEPKPKAAPKPKAEPKAKAGAKPAAKKPAAKPAAKAKKTTPVKE